MRILCSLSIAFLIAIPALARADDAPAKPLAPQAVPSPKPPAGSKKAAPPKPEGAKKAITDLNAVDADYWYQGEYYGRLAAGETLGLQVVALGDGRFGGLEFEGGLPGYDWWPGMARLPLQGTRSGAAVELQSGARRIVITNGTATVSDEANRTLGTLLRVERKSNTLGAPPPAGAIVLFDGSATSQFSSASTTAEHWLKPGAVTKMPVGDFRLHLEFRTPYKPGGRGQDRGNSGVYIQGRYEMQILDSFGLVPQFNDCAAIYRQRTPELNMCYAPLVWQTYDIWFQAARFNACGAKVQNARVTLWHNGVAVHNNVEITAKTGAGKPEGPDLRPILFQDHGNPVAFRNLWLVPGETPGTTSPCERCGLFRRRR